VKRETPDEMQKMRDPSPVVKPLNYERKTLHERRFTHGATIAVEALMNNAG
jgi:hypothetical protein